MRILLTGATGFIGGHLISALHDQHEFICLNRVGGGMPWPVRVLRWNPGNSDALPTLPEGIDAIIHLAQSRQYRHFPEGALDMFRVNMASTAQLLDAAARQGVRWFFLASSGSVYEPYEGPLDEAASLKPHSYYSKTKVGAEELALSYVAQMKVCIFRFFFPYGPGQTGRLLQMLADKIQKREPVVLDGVNGGLRFTPTHIRDVVHLIARALEEQWSGCFNVANPQSVTIRDAAEMIAASLQRDAIFNIEEAAPDRAIMPDLRRLASLYPAMEFLPLARGIETLFNGQTR